jgi:hypothetical protein
MTDTKALEIEMVARVLQATSANMSRTPDEKYPLDAELQPTMAPYWRSLAIAALDAARTPPEDDNDSLETMIRRFGGRQRLERSREGRRALKRMEEIANARTPPADLVADCRKRLTNYEVFRNDESLREWVVEEFAETLAALTSSRAAPALVPEGYARLVEIVDRLQDIDLSDDGLPRSHKANQEIFAEVFRMIEAATAPPSSEGKP